MAVRAIRKTIVARVFVMLVRPNGDSVTKLIRGIKNYTFPCADSTQSFRLGLASMSDRNGAQACMPLVHHKNAPAAALSKRRTAGYLQNVRCFPSHDTGFDAKPVS